MISQKTLFLQHVGQTSPCPLGIEISHAKGIYIYGKDNTEYIDMISGFSVSNVGHCHPKVVEAVKDQVDKYMHITVYGEVVQDPQVNYAKKLVGLLPKHLNSMYFVSSGSEAIEGALKLAKRHTGRANILACKNAYHGSTHGALSIYGGEDLKKGYGPLLPNVDFLTFNDMSSVEMINEQTACVVMEVVQAEGGIIEASGEFIQAVRKKCDETGTVLIFDEIQTGFGRTGKLFAFEHYNVAPDILCIAKGMGGGMPVGAFVSSIEIMNKFTHNPMLGHITTFGGHPVSCAAALASLNVILEEGLVEKANALGKHFVDRLKPHQLIKSFRGKGLFIAVELEDKALVKKVMDHCFEKGLLFDLFLFNETGFRIAPPLTISEKEVDKICDIILWAMEESLNS